MQSLRVVHRRVQRDRGGHGRGERVLLGGIARRAARGVPGDGGRELGAAQHLAHRCLTAWNAADRPAELLAHLRVLDGGAQAPGGDARRPRRRASVAARSQPPVSRTSGAAAAPSPQHLGERAREVADVLLATTLAVPASSRNQSVAVRSGSSSTSGPSRPVLGPMSETARPASARALAVRAPARSATWPAATSARAASPSRPDRASSACRQHRRQDGAGREHLRGGARSSTARSATVPPAPPHSPGWRRPNSPRSARPAQQRRRSRVFPAHWRRPVPRAPPRSARRRAAARCSAVIAIGTAVSGQDTF